MTCWCMVCASAGGREAEGVAVSRGTSKTQVWLPPPARADPVGGQVADPGTRAGLQTKEEEHGGQPVPRPPVLGAVHVELSVGERKWPVALQ